MSVIFFILEKENNEELNFFFDLLRSFIWQVGEVWYGVFFDNDYQLFYVVIFVIIILNQYVKLFGCVVIKYWVSIGIYFIIC